MKQLNSFTDDAKQVLNLILDDESRVNMSINYIAAQAGWFYSLAYGDFAVNNMRMVNSPNMLRKFRNIIPFGLACLITDGYEPIYIDDFLDGRATIYLLNEADITETETLITVTLPTFTGYPLS